MVMDKLIFRAFLLRVLGKKNNRRPYTSYIKQTSKQTNTQKSLGSKEEEKKTNTKNFLHELGMQKDRNNEKGLVSYTIKYSKIFASSTMTDNSFFECMYLRGTFLPHPPH